MSLSSTMSDVFLHRIEARERHYANHRTASPPVDYRRSSEDLDGVGTHVFLPECYPETMEFTDDESIPLSVELTPKQSRTSFGSQSEEDGSSYKGSPLTRRSTPVGGGSYLPSPYYEEHMIERSRKKILANWENENNPGQPPRSVATTVEHESQQDQVPEYFHLALSLPSRSQTPLRATESICSNEAAIQGFEEGPQSARPWSTYNLNARQSDLGQYQQHYTITSWVSGTYPSFGFVGEEVDPFVT